MSRQAVITPEGLEKLKEEIEFLSTTKRREVAARIKEAREGGVISENADGAIEAHDVRTRSVGSMTFIEFHLVVPGHMAVQTAHDICDRIELALRHELGEALINIHVEPEQKAKHKGVVVLP